MIKNHGLVGFKKIFKVIPHKLPYQTLFPYCGQNQLPEAMI